MSYLLLKHVHVLCVLLSFCGFLLRGYWMLRQNPLLQHRLTRTLPHLVDSALLLSAISLAVSLQQYPFVVSWLTAKVVGLCIYIVLGTIALKRGRSRAQRLSAFLAALLVYGWIVSVALTRHPVGLFSLLQH